MSVWTPIRDVFAAEAGRFVTTPVEIAAALGRLVPEYWPSRAGIEVLRNVPYAPTGSRAHLLDIYRPPSATQGGRAPVAIYVHGGGFSAWSKDTFWLPAVLLARAGYLVFNINHRISPAHPFPAPVEDASLAYEWVVREAERFGGDLEHLALSGDSSGANLALGLALAACAPSPEPWAERVFATGAVPRALVCACPFLELSDPMHHHRLGHVSLGTVRRIQYMTVPYLARSATLPESSMRWAEPLRLLEAGYAPERPFPGVFAPVGKADPIVDDTRRLKAAMDRLGLRCESPEYEEGTHAFHLFLWNERAKRCWRDIFEFLASTRSGAPQTRAA